MYIIILTCEHAHIEGKTEFSKNDRHSSLSALKTLTNKPALCKELEYKLAQDVLNRTLIKLSKYLELDEVKQAGVHLGNVHEYVVPSPIHLVTNYASKLSLC